MRSIFLFLLCFLLCGTLVVPTNAVQKEEFDEVLVFDNGNILRRGQEGQIRERLKTVSQDFQVYLYLVTEASIGDHDALAYAEHYFHANDLGCGDKKDGILLLLCMDRREWAIYGNGLGKQAVADGRARMIGEKIRPALIERDYVEALTIFGAECMIHLDVAVNQEKNPIRAGVTMAVFLGSAGALVVVGVVQSRQKKRKEKMLA